MNNKLRLWSFLIALFALGLGGAWWWHGSYDNDSIAGSVTPAVPVLAGVSPRPALVKPKVQTAPLFTPRSIPPESTDSLAIGNLLADSSLDANAVMAALSKMTLADNRSDEERKEALQHLLNLSVEDPAAVLMPLLVNRDLPDSLCSLILDDSLNDSPIWQVDACLAILTARKAVEIRTQAHDHLVFLVGQDHGENIAEWTKSVAFTKEKWAQAQP